MRSIIKRLLGELKEWKGCTRVQALRASSWKAPLSPLRVLHEVLLPLPSVWHRDHNTWLLLLLLLNEFFFRNSKGQRPECCGWPCAPSTNITQTSLGHRNLRPFVPSKDKVRVLLRCAFASVEDHKAPRERQFLWLRCSTALWPTRLDNFNTNRWNHNFYRWMSSSFL